MMNFWKNLSRQRKKLVVGDPTDKKTDMGPLVSAEHRDRVEGYIKSGIDEGANSFSAVKDRRPLR